MENFIPDILDAALAPAANLVVHAGHKDRFGSAHRAIMVASVSDLESIAPHVPDDVVAVSIQQSHEWRDPATKAPHAALEQLAGASEIIIAFSDADTYAGHVEASQLGEHLSFFTTVKYSPNAPGTVGGRVESTSDALRGTFVTNLINNAKKTLGARPKAPGAKSLPKVGPIVDVENGRIFTPSSGDTPETVWLNAAAERTTEVTVWNDLADPSREQIVLRHDLLVHFAGADGLVRSHVVTDVPDSKIISPRVWLNRTAGGAAISPNPNFSNAEKQINSAIREHAPEFVQARIALTRTGWFQDSGEWGYASPSGHLRAAGMSDRVQSDLEPLHKAYSLCDPTALTAESEREAAAVALSTLAELGTHEALTGLMGVTAYSLGGLSGHGRGVGCVPTFTGVPGSGKSFTLRMFYRAFLAPTATGPTLRAHDTDAVLKNAYRGMDAGVVFADDFKEVPYDKKDGSEYVKFDGLARPGYEGSGGGSAKSGKDSDGQWAANGSDPSSPAIIIGTEMLPSGPLRSIKSTLERLFVVEVTHANAFRTGDADAWTEAIADPRNGLHMAAFVRWVASKLDEAKTLDAWRKPWLEFESAERKAMMKRLPRVSNRGAEVGVAPLVGIALWTRYLLEVEAMTESEREQFITVTRDAVSRVAEKHAMTLTGGGTPSDIILDAIHGGIISGKVYVGDYIDGAKAQRIGGSHDIDGKMVTILYPDALLEFLRRDERFRTMSRLQLGTELADVLIKPGGKEQRNTWKIRVDGGTLQVFAITGAKWAPTNMSFDD